MMHELNKTLKIHKKKIYIRAKHITGNVSMLPEGGLKSCLKEEIKVTKIK
jgi:hypothetical protein